MMAAKAAAAAKEAGDMELAQAKQAESDKIRTEAYSKLHHDMQHFALEALIEQLEEIKQAMAACICWAVKAGVDGIEVHGDRLVGSLCSEILNHRQDQYGGSFENRTRYALELVAALREAAPRLILEYKLPIVTIGEDGSPRGKGGLKLERRRAAGKGRGRHDSGRAGQPYRQYGGHHPAHGHGAL